MSHQSRPSAGLALLMAIGLCATTFGQTDQVRLILAATEQGRPIDVSFKDAGELRSQFRNVAARWIAEVPEIDRSHRRNVVALATLRLQGLRDAPSVSLRELVEWMDSQWSATAPTEFERV